MKYLIFVLLLFVIACVSNQQTADIIFQNGKFYTVDRNNPVAAAVAIANGKFIYVGDEVPAHIITEKTEVVDLQGKFVLPGFIDSHVHFMDGGYSLSRIDLRYAGSKNDFMKQIADYAKTLPKGAWILGGNWDHTLWKGQPLPDRKWIDDLTPHNPVFINRLDGHMAVANSLAMQLAGITKETKTPPGGVIVKDAAGRMTGIFKESAKYLVSAAIPDEDPSARLLAARNAVSYLLSLGITSVHDMGLWSHLAVYDSLATLNELKVRVSLYPPLPEWRDALTMKIKNENSGFLYVKGFKAYMDGSLGSATAKFYQPYLNDPNNFGVWDAQMIPPEKMYRRIKSADSLGYQVVIHAIGTEANHTLLEMYGDILQKRKSAKEQRFRIEHAQHLLPEDIPLFAELGVIPSMQPYHCIDDGRWAETKIDYERCKTTYAFRSLLDNGVKPAFGSDWDVAPASPIWGIYGAVTRRTLDDKNPQGWVPEQKISVEEAIRAYTIDAAYAGFSENLNGSIETGKLADLVVLSDNLLEIEPGRITTIEIEKTIVNGEVVFEK